MPDAETRVGFVALVEAAAEAQGTMFIVGARPLGKGWFARCGEIEHDGSDPDMAVRSVVRELQRVATKVQIEAQAQLKPIRDRYVALMDLDATEPPEFDGEATP